MSTAPVWRFEGCTGYAFLGLMDKMEDQYLTKCGLENQVDFAISNPRALRFWFVDYPRAYPEDHPEEALPYKELSVAFLVDARDNALGCNTTAWHLPCLYVTDPKPLEVGRRCYGFPKSLGQVSIIVSGDRGEFTVKSVDGCLIWNIQASGLNFRPVTDEVSWGNQKDWRDDISTFQPRCVQHLGTGMVSPRLEIVPGSMDLAVATHASVEYHPKPQKTPIGLGFQKTGFVLRTRFDLSLRLEDSVCGDD